MANNAPNIYSQNQMSYNLGNYQDNSGLTRMDYLRKQSTSLNRSYLNMVLDYQNGNLEPGKYMAYREKMFDPDFRGLQNYMVGASVMDNITMHNMSKGAFSPQAALSKLNFGSQLGENEYLTYENGDMKRVFVSVIEDVPDQITSNMLVTPANITLYNSKAAVSGTVIPKPVTIDGTTRIHLTVEQTKRLGMGLCQDCVVDTCGCVGEKAKTKQQLYFVKKNQDFALNRTNSMTSVCAGFIEKYVLDATDGTSYMDVSMGAQRRSPVTVSGVDTFNIGMPFDLTAGTLIAFSLSEIFGQGTPEACCRTVMDLKLRKLCFTLGEFTECIYNDGVQRHGFYSQQADEVSPVLNSNRKLIKGFEGFINRFYNKLVYFNQNNYEAEQLLSQGLLNAGANTAYNSCELTPASPMSILGAVDMFANRKKLTIGNATDAVTRYEIDRRMEMFKKEYERYNSSAGGRAIVAGAVRKIKLLEQGFNMPLYNNIAMNVQDINTARMLQEAYVPFNSTGKRYFDMGGAIEINDTYIDRHIIQDALVMFNPKSLHPMIVDEQSVKSKIIAYDMVPGMAPYMQNLLPQTAAFQPITYAETDTKIVNGQVTYLAKDANLKIMAYGRGGLFMDGRGLVSSCIIKFDSMSANPNYNPTQLPVGGNKMYFKGSLSQLKDQTGRMIAAEEAFAAEFQPLF
jgi:hypothetical protein